MMTVLEATAKSLATSMLRVLDRLSFDEWVKRERWQFSQIMDRLIKLSEGADAELVQRLAELETARAQGHEQRHIIVHAQWGQEPDPSTEPAGYDYGRKRLLGRKDIDEALAACAQMRSLASAAAYRLAELIDTGAYPERPDGPGMGMRTTSRFVRF